jgi:hypothetical protein
VSEQHLGLNKQDSRNIDKVREKRKTVRNSEKSKSVSLAENVDSGTLTKENIKIMLFTILNNRKKWKMGFL